MALITEYRGRLIPMHRHPAFAGNLPKPKRFRQLRGRRVEMAMRHTRARERFLAGLCDWATREALRARHGEHWFIAR